MIELRNRAKSPNETLDLSEVMGKAVISKDGKKIGSVVGFHVDPRTLTVEGITINRGFMEENEYIGREYLHIVSHRGIVLEIDPVNEVVGLPVYDARGKLLGEVKSVERHNNSNELANIEVDRGMFKRNLIVPKESIRDLGKGIMLNVAVQG